MHWASKMQTEIALSTTEAEYIALSQSMREVLPIMWLLQEAHDNGIPVLTNPPKIHCKVFEDNAGAIEIAKVPKMRPRTKHLNIKYHHFREEVKKGNVSNITYLVQTTVGEDLLGDFQKSRVADPVEYFQLQDDCGLHKCFHSLYQTVELNRCREHYAAYDLMFRSHRNE